MNLAVQFCHSSIGKKWIVALTGLVLIGYVIGHLIGNLQIFWSPERLNAYAVFLHSMGPLLWLVRILLLGAFVLHIAVTIQLAIANRKARTDTYELKRAERSTLASRTMVISGLIVLCFVIFHILHFTTHSASPELYQFDPDGHLDVYNMVVLGFKNIWASAFYLLALFLLALHLSHGFSSFVQTLGLTSRRTIANTILAGRVLAWVIFAGYASIPIAVLTGLLRVR